VVKVYFWDPGTPLNMGTLLFLGPHCYTTAPRWVIFHTDCLSQSTPK